jgi:hypothetical protein
LVGFATSNSNPGAGADIVMESIALIDPGLPVLNEALSPGYASYAKAVIAMQRKAAQTAGGQTHQSTGTITAAVISHSR